MSNAEFKNIELLSPAGDRERLEFAVRYGADAVYLGGKEFGLRVSAAKFDFNDMKSAVSFAHENDVKVYLTCNSILHNDEIERIPEFLKNAEKTGIDAVIISDVGVLAIAKKHIPDMDIHISTQFGIVNYVTANELYKMGASRVVLARELSLEEISRIRDKVPADLDLEAFVHGAMCVSFSGRCLLSSYLTGRDANRGDCAQPCRWKYHLMEEKRDGQFYKIIEEEEGTYILNAKDLCMISHLDKMHDAGINCFKIEGRAKSFYYTAVTTNAYRMAIDSYKKAKNEWLLEPWLFEEVHKVSHRRYSTGFYLNSGEDTIKEGQFYENGGYIRNYDVVAVIDRCEGNNIYVTQRNKFITGDILEILQPGEKPELISDFNLYSMDGDIIESAPHSMMKLIINTKVEKKYVPGSIIRMNTEKREIEY